MDEQKNLLCKLQNVKKATRGKIKPSGENKFNRTKYPTLDDIIPVIGPACDKEKIGTLFFPKEDGMILNIVDLEKPEDLLEFRIPWKEVESMGGKSGHIQGLGSYITYSRRYLYYLAFDICVVDDIEEKNNLNSTNDRVDALNNFVETENVKKINVRSKEPKNAKKRINEVTQQHKIDLSDGEKIYNKIISSDDFTGDKDNLKDVYSVAQSDKSITAIGLTNLVHYMEAKT